MMNKSDEGTPQFPTSYVKVAFPKKTSSCCNTEAQFASYVRTTSKVLRHFHHHRSFFITLECLHMSARLSKIMGASFASHEVNLENNVITHMLEYHQKANHKTKTFDREK
jgi:hypothetical protein